MIEKDLTADIINEIVRVTADLGGMSDILGIIGRWRDTMDDEWVLRELKAWRWGGALNMPVDQINAEAAVLERAAEAFDMGHPTGAGNVEASSVVKFLRAYASHIRFPDEQHRREAGLAAALASRPDRSPVPPYREVEEVELASMIYAARFADQPPRCVTPWDDLDAEAQAVWRTCAKAARVYESNRCARIARFYRHHALWTGLFPVSSDEAVATFGQGLAARIEGEIRREGIPR